ncbi:hypothetical protein [Cyanobium gracile]|uniref:hypothetical protein n=1 Tax=Cyanobium gracile TaxID=59930 RepID=UPI0005B8A638|nr:hypothetical protein [Cyanobium gracile]
MRRAEILDAEEDKRYGKGKLGSDPPDEQRRRQDRLARIRQAHEEMEAETAAATARQQQEEAAEARAKAAAARGADAQDCPVSIRLTGVNLIDTGHSAFISQVTLYSAALGVAISQACYATGAHHELAVLRQPLGELDLESVLIQADALHTQQPFFGSSRSRGPTSS